MTTYWDTHTDYLGHARVREGERLTVLSRVDGKLIPERVYAQGTASADRFCWRSATEHYVDIAFYVDENTRWCRGWVDDEGNNALLAAFALARAA